MTDSLARLKQTCVFIRSPDGSTGSGYLIAPQRIATAYHVVSSWSPGQPVAVEVGVGGARHSCKATLLAFDDVADAAVLAIEESLAVDAMPVADSLDRKAAWDGYGFPDLANATDTPNGLNIDGHVQDPDTLNDENRPAVLLFSEKIAAGKASPLHGWSGSPVVVDGALVGHLVKHIGDIDDDRRAAYGYVYACPIGRVVALLGDVKPQRREIAPQPIVTITDAIPLLAEGEYHVFVSYRSTDRAWALSLVARMEGAGLRVFIDQQELQPGDYLAAQLQSALQRSRAAVVLVSQGWLASPWCQQEANVLISRAVEDKSFKLVPLRLDGSAMPVLLNSRVWLDFNGKPKAEGEAVERLLNALIGRREPPADSPSARAETADRKTTDDFVARIRVAGASDAAGRVLEVLEAWRKTASSDVAPLIAAAEVLSGKNRFREALQVLDTAPADALRVRQLRPFALRKLGRVDEAIDLLEALMREGHLDAETAGLLAGSYKARWIQTGNNAFRQRAYELYREAYERSGDAFNGINAAAMALQCGDMPKMYQFAGQVVELLKKKPEAELDHWEMASFGEGYLLNGRSDDARDWYGRAVAEAAGLHQDIAVMRRQARLDLKALKQAPDKFDDVLPVPRVLAYIGHMTDAPGRGTPRFPVAKVGAVRNAIRGRLENLGALHGFGSAARGTDLLFLEELDKRGLTATVVLPFPEADYLDISVGGQWNQRFATLKAKAAIDFEPPLQAARPADADLPAAFGKTNQQIQRLAMDYAKRLDETPLVIAVWDGQSGDGPGGTADAVELWQMEGINVDVIDITTL